MAKKKRKPDSFDYMDDLLDELIVQIVRLYNSYKTRALKFDELNALEETKTLYRTIEEQAETLFLEVAWWYYENLGGKKKPKEAYDEDWLMEFLDVFDPVTGYQYYPELDRKMYRQYEEVVSQIQNKISPNKRIERSQYLLTLQITQKAIATVDKVVLDICKEKGIKKVRWHTRRDELVCDECRPRDLMIFALDDLPVRHPRCRCWLEPVKDEDKR